MHLQSLLAISLYFALLLGAGLRFYRRHATSTDFLLGGRSLNYYVTALSAHASDMSSWLLMAYPAMILMQGLFQVWIAIGLIVGMYLNWHFIAPKIRRVTEEYDSLTLSSYFEARFNDKSGLLRLLSSLAAFLFFTIYISSGLVGLGLLFESLFGIDYAYGVFIGVCIAMIYPLIGGYVTLAWTDLFQGLFLMAMIILVPLHALGKMQSLPTITSSGASHTVWEALSLALGWGLGYFGQPHIITKFMGLHNVDEMHKSKYVGICWLIITLAAATFIGLIGINYFKTPLENPEMVFIKMVQDLYPPFFASFILCAILAAVVSVVGAQILILTSHITEDFYKKLFRPQAEPTELVLVARLGIFASAFIAFLIAYFKIDSIFGLVAYAWTGLGCSFGPLLILSLYSKRINRRGAIAGILFGSLFSAIWPLFELPIPAMILGFFLNIFVILSVSTLKIDNKS